MERLAIRWRAVWYLDWATCARIRFKCASLSTGRWWKGDICNVFRLFQMPWSCCSYVAPLCGLGCAVTKSGMRFVTTGGLSPAGATATHGGLSPAKLACGGLTPFVSQSGMRVESVGGLSPAGATATHGGLSPAKLAIVGLIFLVTKDVVDVV